jgi:transcription antitermination factor NusA-like protein
VVEHICAEFDKKAEQLTDGIFKFQFAVPAKDVSKIIGVAGGSIKLISGSTGTKLSVSTENLVDYMDERLLTIDTKSPTKVLAVAKKLADVME